MPKYQPQSYVICTTIFPEQCNLEFHTSFCFIFGFLKCNFWKLMQIKIINVPFLFPFKFNFTCKSHVTNFNYLKVCNNETHFHSFFSIHFFPLEIKIYIHSYHSNRKGKCLQVSNLCEWFCDDASISQPTKFESKNNEFLVQLILHVVSIIQINSKTKWWLQ